MHLFHFQISFTGRNLRQRKAGKRSPQKRNRTVDQSLGGIMYEDLSDSESLPNPSTVSDHEIDSDDESSMDIGIKVKRNIFLWSILMLCILTVMPEQTV